MLKWLALVSFVLLSACDGAKGSFAPTSSIEREDTPPPIGPDAPVKMASTIGQALNPSSTAPLGGFRAFYFDRRSPGQAVAQDDVADVAIKYAWADFHKIDSPDFGGYWVGRLKFDAPTTQQISVSLSWSKARIFVNGERVFEGDSKGTFTHDFRAGENIVEVEFANGWHTTEFKVTFQDTGSVQRIDAIGISSLLRGRKYADVGLAYVGIYESGAQDTGVTVNVPAAQRSPVLWLSSYEAVEWRVRSAIEIPLVVVTAYTPGSRVHGVPADRVVYLDDGSPVPRISSPGRRCSCTSGYYHCEGDAGIADVAAKLREMTGLELTGYALDYATANIAVMPWDAGRSRAAEAARDSEDDARRQCSGPELPPMREPRQSQPFSNWRF